MLHYGTEAGVQIENCSMTVLKMGFFKSKAEKELDSIIQKLEMNMSNNYKDNAQDNLKELEAAVNTMREGGNLRPVILTKYENILAEYKSKMKGYSHKDQKPYWT